MHENIGLCQAVRRNLLVIGLKFTHGIEFENHDLKFRENFN